MDPSGFLVLDCSEASVFTPKKRLHAISRVFGGFLSFISENPSMSSLFRHISNSIDYNEELRKIILTNSYTALFQPPASLDPPLRQYRKLPEKRTSIVPTDPTK